MTIKKLSMALAAALLALPMVAAAQDEEGAEEESSRLSWNLALTTNYMFRGADLSDDHPALQGGLDFAFDHGIYAGTWASNVDFADSTGPDLEWDFYVGWSRDLSDDWNIDLMASRYHYFGARDSYGNIDYIEYFANISYQGLVTFQLAYTNDYSNSSEDAWYYGLSSGGEFGEVWSWDTNVGLSTFDSALGLEDYMDFSIGISRGFGPGTATLRFHAVDSDGRVNWGRDIGEDKLVFTYSIEG